MPGRFAETLDSCPHRTTGFFFTVVGLDDNLNILGSAGLRCRAGGAAGRLCQAGMWRARYRSRWASPCSLGEPSNKVGRASTKGPLGEPLNFHSGLPARHV